MKKRIERTETLGACTKNNPEAVVVPSVGTLYGEWPDGTPFEGNRHVDRKSRPVRATLAAAHCGPSTASGKPHPQPQPGHTPMLGQAQQLDIFNDSHDVMLRNDLAHAVLARDVAMAIQALARLAQAYPDDSAVGRGEVLVAVLHDMTGLAAQAVQAVQAVQAAQPAQPAHPAQPALGSAAIARDAQRRHFNETVVTAAIDLLGAQAAAPWLSPARKHLAQAHAGLPWDPQNSDDHAAPLRLAAGCWQEAADAVASIASWRRIPTPLAWMLQARYRLHGLDSIWPLLAELAWLAPAQLAGLLAELADPLLQRLLRRFNQQFEPQEEAGAAAQPEADLAWFPAWVLTETPALVQQLALAQPGQHRRPEQGFRALVHLLGLERQGRHADLMQQRKALRDIHAGLYRAYMASR